MFGHKIWNSVSYQFKWDFFFSISWYSATKISQLNQSNYPRMYGAPSLFNQAWANVLKIYERQQSTFLLEIKNQVRKPEVWDALLFITCSSLLNTSSSRLSHLDQFKWLTYLISCQIINLVWITCHFPRLVPERTRQVLRYWNQHFGHFNGDFHWLPVPEASMNKYKTVNC